MISAGWFVVMACSLLNAAPTSYCYYTAGGDGLRTEQDCQQYGRMLSGKKNINVPSFKCVELFKRN